MFCSNRIPEAALMARSYLPSKVSEIVALWRKDLSKVIFHSYALKPLSDKSVPSKKCIHEFLFVAYSIHMFLLCRLILKLQTLLQILLSIQIYLKTGRLLLL